MKLVDANLLLYATDERSPRHRSAREWLEARLRDEPVAFAWAVLLAFLRLSTNPRVFEHPLSAERAFDCRPGWRSRAPRWCTPATGTPSRQLLGSLGTAGNLVTDAHLAALAIEHGAELSSCDTDFARFAGLRWRNPIA